MAALKKLIKPEQLKFDYVDSFLKSPSNLYLTQYDKDLDTLFVYFACPTNEVVTHFMDDFIAVLFQADTMEVIGFQVEDMTVYAEQNEKFKKLLRVVNKMPDDVYYWDISSIKAKKDEALARDLARKVERKVKLDSLVPA